MSKLEKGLFVAGAVAIAAASATTLGVLGVAIERTINNEQQVETMQEEEMKDSSNIHHESRDRHSKVRMLTPYGMFP